MHERILGWTLEAGYGGLFDLELYDQPGRDSVELLARALDDTSALFDRLGA